MSEIKTKPYILRQNQVVYLDEGEKYTYITGPEDYLITEDNSIADIIRFALDQAGGDKEEIRTLLEMEDG